jgi:glycosyltransferase involved in cell wall biosynthesis
MSQIALVHDWLVQPAGAEVLLEAICKLYPGPIHTLVHDAKEVPMEQEVRTSFLQKLPYVSAYYRYLLPLFPCAIENFDLSTYDLILSSSHAVAKNVLTHSRQLHICYCHTPMRYAWDLYHEYVRELSAIKGWCARSVLRRLRIWDATASTRVDHFIANSHYVARRIKKNYGREATVIYPPVRTERFRIGKKDNFYLVVSRLVPYKKIDLLVRAFSNTNRTLIVVGDGPEMEQIKRIATQNIEILGKVADAYVVELLSKARALLIAADEDFGLSAVEAQASGTPVIGYGHGGILETVISERTGLFFREQNVSSLREALDRFEKSEFDSEKIRKHALQFDIALFNEKFSKFVEEKRSAFHSM